MKQSVTLALILTLMVAFSAPGVVASGLAEKVVLVLWHGLTWEDARSLELEGPLAWGFLNTRSGGGDHLTGAYLSISAGARAVGWSGAKTFVSRDVGEHIYRLHSGAEPGIFVQPNISLINGAQNVSYKVKPGALGQAFYDANFPVRVLGNSDGVERVHWAALVGMDSLGRVWEGLVDDEFNVLDPRYPYGVRTDYSRLAEHVLQAEDKLVVVDLGDPFRFDTYEQHFLAHQKEINRLVMVSEAQNFMQILARERPTDTVVLLISPHPGKDLAAQGYWLTPVLSVGLTEGLLISGTTRWPGIITNMDIAPTILELLQIEAEDFIGRPATVQHSSETEVWLENMIQEIGILFRYRTPILRAVVVAQILVYTLVLASLIVNCSLPSWALRVLEVALLVLLSIPFSLLFWSKAGFITLVFPIVLIVLGLKYVKPLTLIGIISLGTAISISLDVLGGSWLMRYSPLGYDPIGGARFYGIGNEYMGVLVGSAIMGWAVLAEHTSFGRRQKVFGILFFTSLIIIVGYPSLGTNVGGAIAAVFGFGSTWFTFIGKKNSWRTGIILSIVVVLVLGTFMVLDGANTPGEQSHIGQTVELFRRQGLAALILIIERKLAMNLRLIRYSIWSRALFVTLGAIAASFIWPSKFIFWLKKTHPFIAKGVAGVVIGSVFALIFNDSGVVAAATCISFGSSPLLLLALNLKHNLTAP